jgi:phosphopantothenoylcysteine synthetase/decarboxylase
MNVIVTAGPAYEPLDRVRRLTNFSTGRLGSELARYFTERGDHVTLLVGEQATWHGERRAARVETFSTTASLAGKLRATGGSDVQAVFHAAAVSDFTFGKVWERSEKGELIEIKAGKIPTRAGALTVELIPAPKLIYELRAWFPKACLVGWKYEMDGARKDVIDRALRQIEESKTDFCVANGAAYGAGFGVVDNTGSVEQCDTIRDLFPALAKRVPK